MLANACSICTLRTTSAGKMAEASPTPDRRVATFGAKTELRIGKMLLEISALDTGERKSYLRRLTVTQPRLLAEAEQRLRQAADLPASFLAVPAADLLEAVLEASAAAAPESSPEDRYEIGDPLGEGGMATVYKAFDRHLQRPVALKFLDHADPRQSDLLLREARAQAGVRHPAILEVYDTGELDQRPYISMRWVDGPTVLQLGEEIAIEQRVRLLAQIAEGLQVAHGRGLIHRDIKPSNILVEANDHGGWTPWLTDFGVAAWQEPAAGGGTDDSSAPTAGTPVYMAPEALEANAQPDRRADIYALGVTLYQLLCGQLPHSGDTLPALLRSIHDDPPVPLRQRLSSLPKDLAAIVHRCLAKDPEQRYRSARALAEDLWRYLDGEEVAAYATSRAERLSRFAVRHRWILSVGAIATVLLIGALVIAAALGVEARLANRRAADRRAQAEDMIGYMLTSLRQKLAAVGRLEILDEIGERAMAYFSAVPEAELSDDELAFRSRALYQIGEVRLERFDFSGALPPLEESLDLAQALADRAAQNPRRLFDLGQSHFWVGKAYWDQQKSAAARHHFEAYLDLSERLVELRGENLDYQLELAYAQSNLGSVLQELGELGAARQRFSATLEINQELVDREPENARYRFELAATHNLLAVLASHFGKFETARGGFASELAERRWLTARQPDNLIFRDHLATALDYQGELLFVLAQWPEAEDHLRRAEAMFSQLRSHDPQNLRWQAKLARTVQKLGAIEWHTERRAAARLTWSRLGKIAEGLEDLDAGHREVRRIGALAGYRRAFLFHADRQWETATQDAQRALHLLGDSDPPDTEDLGLLSRLHLLLGSAAAELGQPDQARRRWQRVLTLTERAASEGTSPLLVNRARALHRLGRTEQAQRLAEQLADRGIALAELRWRSPQNRPPGQHADGRRKGDPTWP